MDTTVAIAFRSTQRLAFNSISWGLLRLQSSFYALASAKAKRGYDQRTVWGIHHFSKYTIREVFIITYLVWLSGRAQKQKIGHFCFSCFLCLSKMYKLWSTRWSICNFSKIKKYKKKRITGQNWEEKKLKSQKINWFI